MKVPNGKLRGIPFSESYADTFGQTDRHGWTDMVKLIGIHSHHIKYVLEMYNI